MLHFAHVLDFLITHLELKSHMHQAENRVKEIAQLEAINYAEAVHYHNIKDHFCELINNEPKGKAVISKSDE